MTFFTELQHPRAVTTAFDFKAHSHPEARSETDDRTSEWEATYDQLTGAARHASPISAALLRHLTRDESLPIAAAAQADARTTAGELQTLIDDRLHVNIGLLLNPNFDQLPIDTQLAILDEAFPEERLLAARNASLPAYLLDHLAEDDDDNVRFAAADTLAAAADDVPRMGQA
jgi:hypothetical protein